MKNQYQANDDEDPEEFAKLMMRAVMVAAMPEIARNQFEHYGYGF